VSDFPQKQVADILGLLLKYTKIKQRTTTSSHILIRRSKVIKQAKEARKQGLVWVNQRKRGISINLYLEAWLVVRIIWDKCSYELHNLRHGYGKIIINQKKPWKTIQRPAQFKCGLLVVPKSIFNRVFGKILTLELHGYKGTSE